MYYCYVLYSKVSNYTYVGKTNDPNRRIRQHNGEISGGAKSTRKRRPWNIYILISGFKDEIEALRFEYMMKHYKRYHGKEGRIKTLNAILESKKIHQKLDKPKLTIKIAEEYLDKIVDVDFVKVKKLVYLHKN